MVEALPEMQQVLAEVRRVTDRPRIAVTGPRGFIAWHARCGAAGPMGLGTCWSSGRAGVHVRPSCWTQRSPALTP